jgi:DNA replication protein DnaC
MSLEAASIAQHCKTLRLSAIQAQFASLAEEASQQNHSHLHYLEALLQAEVEDRERRAIQMRRPWRSSTSPSRRISRRRAFALWPKAAIWNVLSRSF